MSTVASQVQPGQIQQFLGVVVVGRWVVVASAVVVVGCCVVGLAVVGAEVVVDPGLGVSTQRPGGAVASSSQFSVSGLKMRLSGIQVCSLNSPFTHCQYLWQLQGQGCIS